MQNVLRDKSEEIVKIKQVNNNMLPQGLLSSGKDQLEDFLTRKKNDLENEKRPQSFEKI